FLRLCSRAPRIAITRAPSADAWRRGRPWSKRSFIRSVARSIGGGQGGHTHQAKEASRRSSPRGAPKERSKNGDVSLARRPAPALSALSCGQRWRPRHGPQRCGGSPNEPSGVRAFLDGQIRQCDVDTPKRDGRSRVAGESFNGRASMKDVIAFILGNVTLTFFVLGLLPSAIALCRARPPRPFGHRPAGVLPLGRGRRSRLSDDHGTQFRPWERRHHFTAMSWFRSWASYFSGCNIALPDRSNEGQRDGKNARRSG